jgi:hypothetical protein
VHKAAKRQRRADQLPHHNEEQLTRILNLISAVIAETYVIGRSFASTL